LGEEATTHGVEVWNYSSNQYVVRVTYENGSVETILVPPRSDDSITAEGLDSGGPREAVVMDGQCTTHLATLQLSGGWAGIVIDASGHVTAATVFVPGTGDSLPRVTPQALPSACA
jgi:hypothetical protein